MLDFFFIKMVSIWHFGKELSSSHQNVREVLTWVFVHLIGDCNTILSATTKYRHLG